MIARFWSFVDQSGDCWTWLGSRNHGGYGAFSIGDKIQMAHRVSYELAHGPIEAGLVVRHLCDTPHCVRPEHLTIGTHAENAADKVARGGMEKGTRSAGGRNLRLAPEAVRAIRTRYAAGGVTFTELAGDYGVTLRAISDIIGRRSWADLDDGGT